MIDRERISRWLDDDLPTGERAAMQARMRDEPALRAEVERMRGLVDDLHDLIDELPELVVHQYVQTALIDQTIESL